MPASLKPIAPALRSALLRWYDAARRDLPWRAPPSTRGDPYHILVSEVMLQQTTVATVRPRYAAFLARFPTVAALAAAPLDDVLHAWQGLGYYRRARALHACARAVVAEHGGRMPAGRAALESLPGIGPYTAAAVAAIAFDEPTVAVDGNVERVLSRLLALDEPLPGSRPYLRRAAEALAAPERPGDFAQALMELGALVCTPRSPTCLTCPWRPWCKAAVEGAPERYPVKAERRTRPERHATAFLLARADGAILFRRRPPEGLLGGMIELPSTPWQAETDTDPGGHAPERAAWTALPGQVRHVFTHFALNLDLWRGESAGKAEGLWVRERDFGELALPTLTRKLLRHAGLRA